MIEEDRLIGGENQSNEDLKATSVRPNSFADYIGQEDVKSQMTLFIEAARSREDVLDHCLIYGCLLYTSPSPRDRTRSRMPSSA